MGDGTPRKLLAGGAAVLDVILRYDAGELTADIARRHNVSSWVVRRCLHEHEVEMDRRSRRRGSSKETIEKYARARVLHANGLSFTEVGRCLGVSPQAVHKALREPCEERKHA